MGRRPSGALPVMRRHKLTNTARIVINGKVYSLGRWGSDEARMRFDTFIAAYVTSGRTSIDAAKAALAAPAAPVRPAVALRAAVAPVAPSPAPSPADDGLTVGELANRYLRFIKETKPNYRGSSLWHGAIAASRAIRPVAGHAHPPAGWLATRLVPSWGRRQPPRILAPEVALFKGGMAGDG